MLDNVVLLLVYSVILVDDIVAMLALVDEVATMMLVMVDKIVTMLVLLVSDDRLSLLLVKAMVDE